MDSSCDLTNHGNKIDFQYIFLRFVFFFFCEGNVIFLSSVIIYRFAILHYSFVSKWNECLQNLVIQVTPMIVCILTTSSNSVFNQYSLLIFKKILIIQKNTKRNIYEDILDYCVGYPALNYKFASRYTIICIILLRKMNLWKYLFISRKSKGN